MNPNSTIKQIIMLSIVDKIVGLLSIVLPFSPKYRTNFS